MRIRRRHLEGRKRGLRAIPEESNNGILKQDVMRRKPCQVRQGQGKHRKLVLCLEMEDAAAGHQHLEMGTRSQEVLDLRSSVGYLLEVVQDQQQVFVAQRQLEAVEQRDAPALLAYAQGASNLRGDQSRVTDRRQVHQDRAVAHRRRQLHGSLQREAGLARACRAGQREQSDVVARQLLAHQANLVLATDQRRRLRRNAMRWQPNVRARKTRDLAAMRAAEQAERTVSSRWMPAARRCHASHVRG